MDKSWTSRSWVDICDEEFDSSSSAEENNKDGDLKVKKETEENSTIITKNCTVEINKDDLIGQNTPKKVPPELNKEEMTSEKEIKNKKPKSPWKYSYASILKNSSSKDNITNKQYSFKHTVIKSESLESTEGNITEKNVKREIQREFLQEDLSLSSHLDIFHMQSPLKQEPLSEVMGSPIKEERETRSVKKRLGQAKLSLCEDATVSDDVLMPSPRKVTRLSTRRKREPGESPLTCKRSKNSSGPHNTPKCVVPVAKSPVEMETDEQILLRRQKQIDYGKNTIGYERYCQMIPKEKRHRKHPHTPPKHIKYSRRAWDGLIRQWRQKLHFWDPPSEGGGNIDDLDISSMSETSSDTGSLANSLPTTPRDNYKSKRYSRFTRSSASESSSIADDTGCSPLKDN